MHRQLGNEVRIMTAMIKKQVDVMVSPGSWLFAWMLRHAAYLIGLHHRRSDGTTPFHCATGNATKVAMAQFGEHVHFKIPETTKQGKSALRWQHGVWVGIDENLNHIVLNGQGAHLVRAVRRLVK